MADSPRRARRRKDTGFEKPFPTDGISRPIGDVKRFPAFDGLRAFAAVAVVAVHAAFFSGFSRRSSYATYTGRLEIGVTVFFVISGFLLYRPFALSHLTSRTAPGVRKFWTRRLFRIIPAYWVALTISVYVLHIGIVPMGWTGALSHYLLLQTYFPTQFFSGIGQSWSLCVEVSFYLFLPLYALVVANRRGDRSSMIRRELVALLIITAISFGYRAWVLSRHSPCGTHCFTDPAITSIMGTWLPAYLDLFAIGMLLAVTSAWFATREAEPAWLRHRAMPWVSWALALGAFLLVSHLGISSQPLYVVTPPINILRQTLYGLFALFLVAPAVFGRQDEGAIRRLLRLAPVAWIGVVSYGIYLWHQALIQAFYGLTSAREFASPFWILFAVVLGLTTVVATASYLLVEQPLLEYASRITRRRRTTTLAKPEQGSRSGPVGPAGDGRQTATRPRVDRRSTWPSNALVRTRSWFGTFTPRWFLPWLLAVGALAVGVRTVFAVIWTFGKRLPGDGLFYHQAAASLAAGKGYAVTSLLPPHRVLPTAQHPPLFSMFLAVFDLLGLHSADAQRILLGIVASVGVVLTGLIAHRVGGPVVGLVAASIAALDPLWFQPGSAVMSESLTLVVIPAILLLALACLDHPSRWRFALLGVATGLAILTRSDAVLLAVVLGAPLVLFVTRSGRDRLTYVRYFMAALVLVLTPWLLRNEVQLGGFTLSDNQGDTLAGSYCPPDLNVGGPYYGGFDAVCAEGATGFLITRVPAPNNARSWSELEINNALWSSTQPFIRGHLDAFPRLALARIENTWGLARTNQNIYQSAIEGRIARFERFGLELGRVLLAFELVGAVVLFRRSRSRFFVLVAPMVAVTINSALFYGSTRFITSMLPSLAVLAALGLGAAVTQVRRHLCPTAKGPDGEEEPALSVAEADVTKVPAGVSTTIDRRSRRDVGRRRLVDPQPDT